MVVSQIDTGLVKASVAALDRLQPLLDAASLLSPQLPADAADLIQRSRPLLDDAASMLMPMLPEIRASIPDVRRILEVVEGLGPVMTDVETRIAGLPGAGLMRKRGEREIERAAEEEQDDETG